MNLSLPASLKLSALAFIFPLLCACYHPPYNNFRPYHREPSEALKGAAVGTVVGAAAGSTLLGTGIGAGVYTVKGFVESRKANTIKELKKAQIQYLRYGDIITLVIPTDRYFLFNSAKLDQYYYKGLSYVIQMLKFYPYSTFYIAGFTDELNSNLHKKVLSRARAETILTYLWANGISNTRLHAEGYADKPDVSPNNIVHASAQNRRVEIQWIIPNRDLLMKQHDCCAFKKVSEK